MGQVIDIRNLIEVQKYLIRPSNVMTAEVVDIRDFLKQKTWLVTRHNEAWDIFNKYAEKYQAEQKELDLKFAQQWMEAAMLFGFKIDELEAKKWPQRMN